MLVRVAGGITNHFPARASEWVMSVMMIHWGVNLLRPDDLFSITPALSHMRLMASENVWGWGAVSIGATRLVALVINGSFPDTWYGRWSPHVRALMSWLSAFVWFQVSIGLYMTNVNSLGLAIYPWLFVMCLWNAMNAAGDASKMDRQVNGGS